MAQAKNQQDRTEFFIDDAVGQGWGPREENNASYVSNASKFLSEFYSRLPNTWFDVYIILENGVVHSIRNEGRVWPGTFMPISNFKMMLDQYEHANDHYDSSANEDCGPFSIRMFFANLKAKEAFEGMIRRDYSTRKPYIAAAGTSVKYTRNRDSQEAEMFEYRMMPVYQALLLKLAGH